jgi:hypothetical protein
MQIMNTDSTESSRLRFVFGDAVVSFSLATDTTLEDVARALGELAPRCRGNPVAIDVRFAARPRSRRAARRSGSVLN